MSVTRPSIKTVGNAACIAMTSTRLPGDRRPSARTSTSGPAPSRLALGAEGQAKQALPVRDFDHFGLDQQLGETRADRSLHRLGCPQARRMGTPTGKLTDSPRCRRLWWRRRRGASLRGHGLMERIAALPHRGGHDDLAAGSHAQRGGVAGAIGLKQHPVEQGVAEQLGRHIVDPVAGLDRVGRLPLDGGRKRQQRAPDIGDLMPRRPCCGAGRAGAAAVTLPVAGRVRMRTSLPGAAFRSKPDTARPAHLPSAPEMTLAPLCTVPMLAINSRSARLAR